MPKNKPADPRKDPNSVTHVQSCSGTTGTCPSGIPKTCLDAPKTIQLPDQVNKDFQKLYGDSFPSGKSQEHGGTLVKDDKGNISVVNQGTTGQSGAFAPNRTVPSGQTIIGTVHTHPYDATEGGHKGVSFSDADMYYASYHKEATYVDGGDRQFMIMPTEESGSPSAQDYKDAWKAAFQKYRKDQGKPFPEATRLATNEVAKKYKMAYYEGKNGVLERVSC